MAGRPDERCIGRLGRHADGVGDAARLHLVVAHQAGEDREARGVGRRPAAGAQGVGVEVPDGPGARRRARCAVLRVVELVQGAGARVDHEGVPVAGRLCAAFYRRVGTERVRTRIALRGVLEGHVHQGLGGRHHRVGNAVRGAGVVRGAEVRMQVGGGAVHAGHPLGAVRGRPAAARCWCSTRCRRGTSAQLGAPGSGRPGRRLEWCGASAIPPPITPAVISRASTARRVASTARRVAGTGVAGRLVWRLPSFPATTVH